MNRTFATAGSGGADDGVERALEESCRRRRRPRRGHGQVLRRVRQVVAQHALHVGRQHHHASGDAARAARLRLVVADECHPRDLVAPGEAGEDVGRRKRVAACRTPTGPRLRSRPRPWRRPAGSAPVRPRRPSPLRARPPVRTARARVRPRRVDTSSALGTTEPCRCVGFRQVSSGSVRLVAVSSGGSGWLGFAGFVRASRGAVQPAQLESTEPDVNDETRRTSQPTRRTRRNPTPPGETSPLRSGFLMLAQRRRRPSRGPRRPCARLQNVGARPRRSLTCDHLHVAL